MAARRTKTGTTVRSVAVSAAKAPPKQSVAQAAKDGSHRDLLVAMRDRIALAVSDPECPPRDLAALTRRLQDIAKEIEGIDQRRLEEGTGDGGEVEDGAFDSSAV
jgi:hypothetical protein